MRKENMKHLNANRVNNYDVYFPPAEYWLKRNNIAGKNINSQIKKFQINKIDSLYIHFPFCPAKCRLCPYIKLDNKNMPEVSSLIIKELEIYFGLLDKNSELKSVLFGGGTPNFIPIKEFEKMLGLISKRFDASRITQVAIELKPGIRYKEHIVAMLKHFKPSQIHISLGLQSASQKLISFYRAAPENSGSLFYSKEDVEKMISYCHDKGINEINIDFMLRNFKELKQEEKYIKVLVEKFKVNKITIYPLFTKFMERGTLSKSTWSFKEMLKIRKSIFKFFESISFEPAIWANYFVKKGSKPNMESWTQFKGTTLLAAGPSSRGCINTPLGFMYYENFKDYEYYRSKIERGILPINLLYNQAGDITSISDDMRHLFISRKRGISIKNYKALLTYAKLSGNEKGLKNVFKVYFKKNSSAFVINNKGYYFIECIYWAIWDLIKEGFEQKDNC
jgi:oxygen-independent coproporphyrinogen III oxidase